MMQLITSDSHGTCVDELGEPKAIGRSLAVAGHLDISAGSLGRIRAAGQLKGPPFVVPGDRVGGPIAPLCLTPPASAVGQRL